MPICAGDRARVTAWSPVIIFTTMPAAWQVRTAPMARARGGSIMPTRPRNTRSRPIAPSVRGRSASRRRAPGPARAGRAPPSGAATASSAAGSSAVSLPSAASMARQAGSSFSMAPLT
jgi:hypothetical protein